MKSFSTQIVIPPVTCTVPASVVKHYVDMLNYRRCSLLLFISSPPATGDIKIYEAIDKTGTTDSQLNISSYRVIDGVVQSAIWPDADYECDNYISIWPGIGLKVAIWVDVSKADMSSGYRYLTLNTNFEEGTIAAVGIPYEPIGHSNDNIGATV